MNSKERECVARLSYESEKGFERFAGIIGRKGFNESLNGWVQREKIGLACGTHARGMGNVQHRTFDTRAITPLIEVRSKTRPVVTAASGNQLKVKSYSFRKFLSRSKNSENFVNSYKRKDKTPKSFQQHFKARQKPYIKIRSILPEKSKKLRSMLFIKETLSNNPNKNK